MRLLLFALCAALPASAAAAAPPKKKPVPVPAPLAVARTTPATRPSATSPDPVPGEQPAGSSVRGPTRIDFDDRLIQGQTNKSGAVYLYDRKELKIRSMIKKRENFRQEIVGSLYDT
jgi:hypothetical protein